MTQALEKAFQEASKLPGEEQEVFAGFILDELAFRAAVHEGIEAADRGEVVPLEEVQKMIPKWASK
jgi:predicted transcriptional regulator